MKKEKKLLIVAVRLRAAVGVSNAKGLEFSHSVTVRVLLATS